MHKFGFIDRRFIFFARFGALRFRSFGFLRFSAKKLRVRCLRLWESDRVSDRYTGGIRMMAFGGFHEQSRIRDSISNVAFNTPEPRGIYQIPAQRSVQRSVVNLAAQRRLLRP